MSESAKAAFAARSASAERSAGTRRNSLSDAGQIQLSSISKGFSSSCTLCKLHAAAHGSSISTISAMLKSYVNTHSGLRAGKRTFLQPP